MVSHMKRVLEILDPQVARTAPHQVAGHFISSGDIAIQEIGYWCTHLQILRNCAQHHESRFILFFQFIQAADQQGSQLPSGVTGTFETSLVPSMLCNLLQGEVADRQVLSDVHYAMSQSNFVACRSRWYYGSRCSFRFARRAIKAFAKDDPTQRLSTGPVDLVLRRSSYLIELLLETRSQIGI